MTLIKQERLQNGKKKDIYGLTDYLKTGAAYRKIDISPELMSLIQKRKIEVNKQKLKSMSYNDQGLICCHEDGTFLLSNSVYREFKKILKKNNMPDIRLHDLRGTFITTMHRAGIPLLDIARYVGHEDVSTTALYLHDTGEETPVCSTVMRRHFYDLAE